MAKPSLFDHQMMAVAISLAKQGQYSTSPNPNVGCVIVKGDKIIAKGWHQKAGLGHAEVNALANATQDTVGATAYVTLEPCSHFGRTPPCALALVNAKVARVVIAMTDPNPLVAGKGIQILKDAGIEVITGLLSEDAKALNKGFLHRMQNHVPWVQVKLAASLDGKTALANGKSKWITSKDARADVQRYRSLSCAILSGADTVIADNAKLNVRHSEFLNESDVKSLPFLRQPVRVVIDSKHRLTPDLALFEQLGQIWLVKTETSNTQWPSNVEEVIIPNNNGFVDLHQLINELGKRQVNLLWVEAGATLAGAFIQQNLADELILYQAPKLLGNDGASLININELVSLDEASLLSNINVKTVGNDIKISANFIK